MLHFYWKTFSSSFIVTIVVTPQWLPNNRASFTKIYKNLRANADWLFGPHLEMEIFPVFTCKAKLFCVFSQIWQEISYGSGERILCSQQEMGFSLIECQSKIMLDLTIAIDCKFKKNIYTCNSNAHFVLVIHIVFVVIF